MGESMDDHSSGDENNVFNGIETAASRHHPEQDITIHINSLHPYTATGGGIFKLSGIKQIET